MTGVQACSRRVPNAQLDCGIAIAKAIQIAAPIMVIASLIFANSPVVFFTYCYLAYEVGTLGENLQKIFKMQMQGIVPPEGFYSLFTKNAPIARTITRIFLIYDFL